MTDRIPMSWTTLPMDELFVLVRGVSYDKLSSSKTPKVDYLPILRANNISEGKLNFDDLVFVHKRFISDEQLLSVGDIVITMSSGSKHLVGKAARLDSKWKGSFGAFCSVARPLKVIDDKYLSFFFQSSMYRDKIAELSMGININNLRQEYFNLINISLPPIQEQKRISSKLDKLFKNINSIQSRLDEFPKVISELRQQILQQAVTGQLTNKWRKHNKTSSSMLRWNIKAKSFSKLRLPNIPQNWFWINLADISHRVSVGYVGPTSKYYCDKTVGVPFIRSQNVRPMKLNLENLQYITKAFHKAIKKSQLFPGDLLIVRVGANRGDVCIVPSKIGNLNCANIVFARPFKGVSKYLEYYCQSKIGKEFLIGMTTGSAQGVLNTKSVAELLIPIPPRNEEKEIIRRLNYFFSKIKNIELKYESLRTFFDELPSRILEKAYEGELVRHNLKDEPVQKLLERIKKEKEKMVEQKKVVKKRKIIKKVKKEVRVKEVEKDKLISKIKMNSEFRKNGEIDFKGITKILNIEYEELKSLIFNELDKSGLKIFYNADEKRIKLRAGAK